ncbi:MAG: hypothetical protein ABIY35_06195, partial [Chitinophagaceae bacterium]
KYLPHMKTVGKIKTDILIIAQNPAFKMADIDRVFEYQQLIFDSSNPLWKTEQWKKDCDSLHLRFHSVSASGAFVMGL